MISRRHIFLIPLLRHAKYKHAACNGFIFLQLLASQEDLLEIVKVHEDGDRWVGPVPRLQLLDGTVHPRLATAHPASEILVADLPRGSGCLLAEVLEDLEILRQFSKALVESAVVAFTVVVCSNFGSEARPALRWVDRGLHPLTPHVGEEGVGSMVRAESRRPLRQGLQLAKGQVNVVGGQPVKKAAGVPNLEEDIVGLGLVVDPDLPRLPQ